MKILYTRNAQNAYMILTELNSADDREAGSGYETMMLEKNELHTLMGYYPVAYNGEMQYWYDIGGLCSLHQYLSREGLSGQILCQLVMDLGLALKELNNYLLSEDRLLLSPETVYISQNEGRIETRLCYCPAISQPLWDQVRELFEYFLALVDHEKKDEMNLCYRLYRILSNEDVSVDRLIEEVSPLKENGGVTDLEEVASSWQENIPREETEGFEGNSWSGREKEEKGRRKKEKRGFFQKSDGSLGKRFKDGIRKKMDKVRGSFRDDRKLSEEDRIFDPEDPTLDRDVNFERIEVGSSECYTQGERKRPGGSGYGSAR